MACFIYPLTNIRTHPTATHLDVANCGPHQVIIGRHYDEGTLGIFIPDGSIVPKKLATEMWVLGRLSGSKKNRVKTRLKEGVRTDGLFYGSRFYLLDGEQRVYQSGPSWNPDWKIGDDVTAQIGVT